MATESGRIEGDDARSRAVATAGWLAEQGVGMLAVVERDGWRELRARETDLPGEVLAALERCDRVELVATDRPIRVVVTHDDATWTSG